MNTTYVKHQRSFGPLSGPSIDRGEEQGRGVGVGDVVSEPLLCSLENGKK